jgi:tetratricopeptide (TPR) repeat protein
MNVNSNNHKYRYIAGLLLIFASASVSFPDASGAVNFDLNYKMRNVHQVAKIKNRAVEILAQATEKEPDNNLLHFALGFLYLNSDNKKALQELQNSIDEESCNMIAYLWIGYLLDIDGDLDTAISYFDNAIQCDDSDPEIYNALSLIYLKKGEVNMAVDVLEKGIGEIQDESLFFNQTLIMMKYFGPNQQKYSLVERNMKKALALNELPEYHFILGTFYLKQGENIKARQEFEKTISLKPKDILAMLSISTTYKNENKFKKAAIPVMDHSSSRN